jgi:DNA polymerase III subunit alpha, Gram-positive type
MFPKAHAAAYVMSAFRIAWFKVYYPIHYYAAYFSIRSSDFDIEVMIKGKDAIKSRITEIMLKGREATNKEAGIVDTLQIALEATARGFKFGNIDLYKSHDRYFTVADNKVTLIPPFRALDGLGGTVAGKIVEEREKAPFLSIEDFQKRGKVSSTLIDKMRMMGILKDLDESSQLSLF